jgi:GNAT superfamily N-acetyltransferase
MIGGVTLNHHDPLGEWLYGVDFAVDPNYRQHGIGTRMYQTRFELVKRLNLRGFYAGGMLMGYHRYQQQMTVREYGEKVIRGELEDPTVTMQMRRGFKAHSVIEQYVHYPQAGHAAVLIEWANPHYCQPFPQHSSDFTRIFISQSSASA